MYPQEANEPYLRVAEAVRAACLATAQESYEEASMRGLCHEGAWEYAMDMVRTLDMRSLLTRLRQEWARRKTLRLPKVKSFHPRFVYFLTSSGTLSRLSWTLRQAQDKLRVAKSKGSASSPMCASTSPWGLRSAWAVWWAGANVRWSDLGAEAWAEMLPLSNAAGN